MRRTWKQCNIPMFVVFIVMAYWHFTLSVLGSHRYPEALDPNVNSPAWLLSFLPRWMFLTGIAGDRLTAFFFGALTLYSLYTAALSDPGPIPGEPIGRAAGALSNPEQGEVPEVGCRGVVPMGKTRTTYRRVDPLFCEWCQRRRPPRAHHCRRCQQCVVRYDHHCDWIDNCVGQSNHKCFMLFILYILICILHYYAMITRFVITHFVSLHSGTTAVPKYPGAQTTTVGEVFHLVFLAMYTFIVFPCSIFALIFLIGSFWNACRNETSYDTATRAAKEGYYKSVFENLKEALGPDPRMWLVPTLNPVVLPAPSTPPTVVVGDGGLEAPPADAASTGGWA